MTDTDILLRVVGLQAGVIKRLACELAHAGGMSGQALQEMREVSAETEALMQGKLKDIIERIRQRGTDAENQGGDIPPEAYTDADEGTDDAKDD